MPLNLIFPYTLFHGNTPPFTSNSTYTINVPSMETNVVVTIDGQSLQVAINVNRDIGCGLSAMSGMCGSLSGCTSSAPMHRCAHDPPGGYPEPIVEPTAEPTPTPELPEPTEEGKFRERIKV